jgi:general stress protein 26
MSSEFRGSTLKQMPPKDLRKRIIEFLKEQNMCVLATCKNKIPRATPIEYHSRELSLYFVAERGAKLRNIRSNPNVSVGIFLPYEGWNSAKGAQITGKAKIIARRSSKEFMEGLEAYGWERAAREIGIKEFPKTVELVMVGPEKIEFIDMSLEKAGYSPRQTLELRYS